MLPFIWQCFLCNIIYQICIIKYLSLRCFRTIWRRTFTGLSEECIFRTRAELFTTREKRLGSNPHVCLFQVSASLLNKWWTNTWSEPDFKPLFSQNILTSQWSPGVKHSTNQSTNQPTNQPTNQTNHYSFTLAGSFWGLLFVSIFQNCLSCLSILFYLLLGLYIF